MGERWRAALFGLGSNLGDRLGYLRGAVVALGAAPEVRVVAGSAVYESPPMGAVPQGPYLNAVVRVETSLSGRELLALALDIERGHGRVREVRWGPRTLDIDILWLAGETSVEPGLTLPHPGLAQRAFVLLPLADVWPGFVLPDGRTVEAASEECGDHGCVRLPGHQLTG